MNSWFSSKLFAQYEYPSSIRTRDDYGSFCTDSDDDGNDDKTDESSLNLSNHRHSIIDSQLNILTSRLRDLKPSTSTNSGYYSTEYSQCRYSELSSVRSIGVATDGWWYRSSLGDRWPTRKRRGIPVEVSSSYVCDDPSLSSKDDDFTDDLMWEMKGSLPNEEASHHPSYSGSSKLNSEESLSLAQRRSILPPPHPSSICSSSGINSFKDDDKKSFLSSDVEDSSHCRKIPLRCIIYCANLIVTLAKYCLGLCFVVVGGLLVLHVVSTGIWFLNCDWEQRQKLEVSSLVSALKNEILDQPQVAKAILDVTEILYGNEATSVFFLVFLGSSGTGKTLATSILRRHFPSASNAHLFSAPLNLLRGGDNSALSGVFNASDLYSFVSSSCGPSLVVFDDLEEETDDSSEFLRHVLDFVVSLKHDPGYGGRRGLLEDANITNFVVVVVTTNAGSKVINDRMVKYTARRDGVLHPVEAVDMIEGYNGETDYVSSSPLLKKLNRNLTIEGVRVKMVPFLPMTRAGVERCVQHEMTQRFASDIPATLLRTVTSRVLAETEFFGDEFHTFSLSGCKNVGAKISAIFGDGQQKEL